MEQSFRAKLDASAGVTALVAVHRNVQNDLFRRAVDLVVHELETAQAVDAFLAVRAAVNIQPVVLREVRVQGQAQHAVLVLRPDVELVQFDGHFEVGIVDHDAAAALDPDGAAVG